MRKKQNHPDTLEELFAETKLRCYTCSYPLKGLTTATCPECGSNLSLEMFTGWGIYRHRARAAMTMVIPIYAGGMAIKDLILATGMFFVATTMPTSTLPDSLPLQTLLVLFIWIGSFIINGIVCAGALIYRNRIQRLRPSRFWTIHIILFLGVFGHWYLAFLITDAVTRP